jgi:hypothetical protein
MSGTDSWSSCGLSFARDNIGFEVDHVQSALPGRSVSYKPKRAEGECHGGTTTFRVEWSFKKVRK